MRADYRVAIVAANLALLLSLVLLGTAGCASYHQGSVIHPQVDSVAVGMFKNVTDEPALAVLLRKNLAEQFMFDGSLELRDADSAEIIVTGVIRRYDINRSSAAKIRDDDSFPDNRTTYRSTIYEARVEVEYQVLIPNQGNRVLMPRRRVVGRAQFPTMPDLNITRQSGLQQALRDAAVNIVAGITEAW